MTPRMEALRTVERFAAEQHEASEYLVGAVDWARKQGCTWSEIGGAIGITQQAAQARFSNRVERVDLRRKETPRRQQLVAERFGGQGE